MYSLGTWFVSGICGRISCIKEKMMMMMIMMMMIMIIIIIIIIQRTGRMMLIGKTCLSVTFNTTELTWTDQGSNPDFRDERPATKRLSHGMVLRRDGLSHSVFNCSNTG
jgi:hypothetical protein